MKINLLNSKATFFALMFLLFILKASNVNAQAKTSLIKGIVTDNNGEPIPGVSVIIRNTQTNFTSGTSTDNSGVFTFSKISPGGPYSFTISTVGYEPQTLSGYNIKEDITLSLSVELKSTSATFIERIIPPK